MLVGYARVSSTGQNLTSQIEALEKAGCEKIFQEKKSGTKTYNRQELLAPDSFGHPAGVDVDSAPESMWTLRRSTCGQLSLQPGT